jgi:hypothetical protein
MFGEDTNKGTCGPVALAPFRSHTPRERFALGYRAGAKDSASSRTLSPEGAFDFFFGTGYRAGWSDREVGAEVAWERRFQRK